MSRKRTYSLILLFVLISFISNAQESKKQYSENQLIGKSALPLYGKKYKLQKEAYFALKKLILDAKKDGISIKVISAYRNFNHQNRIWKRKYQQFISQGYSAKAAVNKVLEYTAIPGTSRHHWGTDVDLSTDDNLLNKKKKLSHWMDENAHKYGFYRVYTNNKLRDGYNYESWHYSYRNLSKPMLQQYYKLDLEKVLKNQNIKGNKYFTKQFIRNYIQNNILGINDYLY